MGGKPALLDRREVPGAGPGLPAPRRTLPQRDRATRPSPGARCRVIRVSIRSTRLGKLPFAPVTEYAEGHASAFVAFVSEARVRITPEANRPRGSCPGFAGRLSCAGRAGARARTVAVRTRPAAEPHSLRIRPSAAAASDSSWVAWRTGSACRRARSRMAPRDRGTSCCREDVRSPWGRLASRSRRHAEARPADRVGIGARSSACTFGGRPNI